MPAFSNPPPVRNPYETFTGKDLDSFVTDIKAKINSALKPPRRPSPPRFRASLVASSVPVLPHLNPLYQGQDTSLANSVEDYAAGDASLNWSVSDKGKGRAADEGPGVEALRNLHTGSQSPGVDNKVGGETGAQPNGFSDDDLPPEDSFRYRRYYYDDKHQASDGEDNEEEGEEELEEAEDEEVAEGEYDSEESVGHTQKGKDYMEDEDGAIVIDDSDEEEPAQKIQVSSPDWNMPLDAYPGGDEHAKLVQDTSMDHESMYEEEAEEEDGPIEEELRKEGFDAIRPVHVIHQESRSGHYDVFDQDVEEDELDDEEQIAVYDDEQEREQAAYGSTAQDILPVSENDDDDVVEVGEEDELDQTSPVGTQDEREERAKETKEPQPTSLGEPEPIASHSLDTISTDANFLPAHPTVRIDHFNASTFADPLQTLFGAPDTFTPLPMEVPTLDPNQFIHNFLADTQQGFPVSVPVGLSVPSIDPLLAHIDQSHHQLSNPLSAIPGFSPVYEGGMVMPSFPVFSQPQQSTHPVLSSSNIGPETANALEITDALVRHSDPPAATQDVKIADLSQQESLILEQSTEVSRKAEPEQSITNSLNDQRMLSLEDFVETEDPVAAISELLVPDTLSETQVALAEAEPDSLATAEEPSEAKTQVVREKHAETSTISVADLSPQSEVTVATVIHTRRSVEIVEINSDEEKPQTGGAYGQASTVEEPRSTAPSHYGDEHQKEGEDERLSIHTVEDDPDVSMEVVEDTPEVIPQALEGGPAEQPNEEETEPPAPESPASPDETSSLSEEPFSVNDEVEQPEHPMEETEHSADDGPASPLSASSSDEESLPKAQEVEIKEDADRLVIDLTSPFSPIGKDRGRATQAYSLAHSETDEEESERLLLDHKGDHAEDDGEKDPFTYMGTGKGGPGEVDDDEYDDGEEDEEIEDESPASENSSKSSSSDASSGDATPLPDVEAEETVEDEQPQPKVIISPPEVDEEDEAAPEAAENEDAAEDEHREEENSDDSDASSDVSDDYHDAAIPDTSPSKASEVATSLADSPSKSSREATPTADRTADLLPQPLALLTSFNLYRHHHGPAPPTALQAPLPIARQVTPQDEDRKSETAGQRSRSNTPSVAPSRTSQVSGSTRERERDPNAVVTRSQCKFHKIAIPVPPPSDGEEEREAGGEARKVIFIVPYCAISDREKIAEEDIEVLGEATRLENETKVAIPEFAEQVIGAHVLTSLLALVGHHIVEEACAWLPSPEEEAVYQRYLKKRGKKASAFSRWSLSKQTARRKSTTARPKSAGGSGSRPGPSRLSTARPKSKKRQAEEELSEDVIAPRVDSSQIFGGEADSDSLTELSDSDSSDSDETSEPTGQPTTTPGKRRRKSGRQTIDPSYKPSAEHSESEASPGERPSKRRRRSTRHKPAHAEDGENGPAPSVAQDGPKDGAKGKKRARPTAAPASVQEAEGTGPPKPAKRRRRDVEHSDDERSNEESEEEGLAVPKQTSILLDSPARHTRAAERAHSPIPPETNESFQVPVTPAEPNAEASLNPSAIARKSVLSWLFRK
ncbi:hypothetical protein FRB90_000522 [Tulasnella sp. 427]|nr:hypothetical protein FRB90_000522 [Tulasnella sp. 427]